MQEEYLGEDWIINFDKNDEICTIFIPFLFLNFSIYSHQPTLLPLAVVKTMILSKVRTQNLEHSLKKIEVDENKLKIKIYEDFMLKKDIFEIKDTDLTFLQAYAEFFNNRENTYFCVIEHMNVSSK